MTNDNSAVLGMYIDGLKTHDLAKIAEAVSDDLVFVGVDATLGKPEFLDMLRAIYRAFPDWSYDHDPPEFEGDGCAIRWRQGGTHTSALAIPGREPIRATGRVVRIPSQHFRYRIRDARIVEIRPDPVSGGAPHGIIDQLTRVES